VRSRDLPALDDEFAKSLGEYESLEELREDARKHLEASTHENYESDFENRILDEIVAGSTFAFPPQMVEDEIDSLVDNFKNRLSNEGWDLDTYLMANQKDQVTLREEFRETAIRRIHRGLVMMEVAEKEGIQVSERDVQLEVQRTIDMVNTSFAPKDSKKILTQDFLRGLVSSAMRDTLTARTFARLKAIAKGEADAEEETAASEEETAAAEPAAEAPAAETPAETQMSAEAEDTAAATPEEAAASEPADNQEEA
jgi:trigger factor